MGERTDRQIRSLRERINGNAKWIALAVALLGGGGAGAGVRSLLGEPVNKELIEYRLGMVEGEIKVVGDELRRLRIMFDERMPPR